MQVNERSSSKFSANFWTVHIQAFLYTISSHPGVVVGFVALATVRELIDDAYRQPWVMLADMLVAVAT